MQEKKLRRLLNRIDIPTLPSVVMEVNRVLMDDYQRIEVISEAIGSDAALTTKVLRIANSSYYGLSYNVDTLTRAITILGSDTIRNLALTISVHNLFSGKDSNYFDFKSLWYHSLGSAIASKALVGKTDAVLQEKAFICGIIHDIGKLIIAQNVPEDTEKILEKLGDDPAATQSDIEMDVLEITHSEVGSIVADKWQLPKEFAEVIRFHHYPKTPVHANEVLLNAGNQVSKALALGRSTDEKVQNIEPAVWKKLGLSEVEVSQILPKIKRDFEDLTSSWQL